MAATLKAQYPKEKLFPDKQSVAVWYELLKDIPYNVAKACIAQWASVNKWSPAISDIREYAVKAVQGDAQEWGQAWEKALKIARSYHPADPGRTERELAELDDLTRQTIKEIDLRAIAYAEDQTANRANFRKIYESYANRKQNEIQTPAFVHKMIDAVSNVMIGVDDGQEENSAGLPS